MRKFQVTVERTQRITVEVEAENYRDAQQIAVDSVDENDENWSGFEYDAFVNE